MAVFDWTLKKELTILGVIIQCVYGTLYFWNSLFRSVCIDQMTLHICLDNVTELKIVCSPRLSSQENEQLRLETSEWNFLLGGYGKEENVVINCLKLLNEIFLKWKMPIMLSSHQVIVYGNVALSFASLISFDFLWFLMARASQ